MHHLLSVLISQARKVDSDVCSEGASVEQQSCVALATEWPSIDLDAVGRRKALSTQLVAQLTGFVDREIPCKLRILGRPETLIDFRIGTLDFQTPFQRTCSVDALALSHPDSSRHSRY